MQKTVIVLLGAPGSGKGTQSQFLKDKYNIAHISTGDMLRLEIDNATEFGIIIKGILEKGDLVSDEIITTLLSERIRKEDCKNGFILDGYPRTLSQAEKLTELFFSLNINHYCVFEINVDDDVLLKRILGRFVCESCGKIYNKYFNSTKKENICDICGGSSFSVRSDDTEETLKSRLSTYHKNILPIVDYYDKLNLLHKLDGTLNLDKLFVQVDYLLGGK